MDKKAIQQQMFDFFKGVNDYYLTRVIELLVYSELIKDKNALKIAADFLNDFNLESLYPAYLASIEASMFRSLDTGLSKVQFHLDSLLSIAFNL